MAINRKNKPQETKAKEQANHSIEVLRARELDNGTIIFDMKVNDVTIYGCNYKTFTKKDGSGEFAKVGFPSRKGSDDNWYSHAYFTVTEDDLANIEKGIEAKL
ncbi:MAG: hypothetical protein J6S49_05110 [Erysipelotrichaceae bacterium]|nr:hypothetical protein [Erysipelotrichaceae bacterium]